MILVIYTPAILRTLKPLFFWLSEYYTTGYLVYILLLVLSLIAFLPETIFILAASLMYKQSIGFAFAFVFTTLATFIGEMIGSSISFILARYCCRNCVRKCLLTRY